MWSALPAVGWLLVSQASTDHALLRGAVTDPRGAPAAGARLHVLCETDPTVRALRPELGAAPVLVDAVADERGRFSIAVPPGGFYRVRAIATDGQEVSAVRSGVRPGEPLRLSLLPACRLKLTAPTPLRWHLLGFDRDRQEEFFLCRGEGELPPLAPGRYRLAAYDHRRAAWQSEVVLHPGQATEIQPRLAAPARLSVHLSGRPADGVTISLPFPIQAASDAPDRGPEVALPALGTTLRLRIAPADAPAYDAVVGPVLPDARLSLEISARSGRSLHVRVPASSGPARLTLAWSESSVPHQRSLDSDRGDFRLTGLPEVEMLAILAAQDGHWACTRVPARGEEIELQPSRGGELVVDVRDPGGEPPHEASLVLVARSLPGAPGLEDLFPLLARYPDRRGRFAFSSLPEGEFELRLEARHHVPVLSQVRIESGRTSMASFALEHGYRLHGHVLDPTGQAAAGILVTLSHPIVGPPTAPLEAITDSDGRFLFSGLPPATYVLEARRSRGARSELARVPRAVPGPEPIELRLRDEDPRPAGTNGAGR